MHGGRFALLTITLAVTDFRAALADLAGPARVQARAGKKKRTTNAAITRALRRHGR